MNPQHIKSEALKCELANEDSKNSLFGNGYQPYGIQLQHCPRPQSLLQQLQHYQEPREKQTLNSWSNNVEQLTFQHHRPLLYPTNESTEASSSLPQYNYDSDSDYDYDNDEVAGRRVRKWSLRFSGSSTEIDIEEFIFRVERCAYGLSEKSLMIGMNHLLTERANDFYWLHQKRKLTDSWDELRQALLSRFSIRSKANDYKIRAEMVSRTQGRNESFFDFCLEIQTLSHRMTTRMPETELVELLRSNMQIHLRKATWLQKTDTLDQLKTLCREFEHLCEEENRLNKHHRESQQKQPPRQPNPNLSQKSLVCTQQYASRSECDYDIRRRMENRKQGSKEQFIDYCQDIESLSVRMARKMPNDELIDLLRRNMQIHLRKAMWQQPTDSIDQLISLCGEFERLCEEEDRLIATNL